MQKKIQGYMGEHLAQHRVSDGKYEWNVSFLIPKCHISFLYHRLAASG